MNNDQTEKKPRANTYNRKLRMIFDMAAPEYKIKIASPYNLFDPVMWARLETCLKKYGLVEMSEDRRIPICDESLEYFPNYKICAVYIVDAIMERIPGGLAQLGMQIADHVGVKTHAINVFSTDPKVAALEEPRKKNDKALLATDLGEAEGEEGDTDGESLHGAKRIATIMKAMARSDEEKFGKPEGVPFTVASSTLKEMFDKPFRKGVWRCVASNGDLIVETRLEDADGSLPHLSDIDEVKTMVDRSKSRSFLEALDYEAGGADLMLRRIGEALQAVGLPVGRDAIGYVNAPDRDTALKNDENHPYGPGTLHGKAKFSRHAPWTVKLPPSNRPMMSQIQQLNAELKNRKVPVKDIEISNTADGMLLIIY